MTDWAALYRANADAVTVLAEGLSDEQLTTPVPATPDWTVREVLGADSLAQERRTRTR